MRLALLGAGRMGLMHARNIAMNARASLVYVADIERASAVAVAEAAGGKAVTIDEMLDAPDVDGIIIASSTDTHAGLLRRLAAAGIPLLCEKPLSLDLAEAEECAAVLNGSGARCMMGFHRRYDPAIRRAGRSAASGEIGRVFQLGIASRTVSPPPDSYIRRSGGLFRDQSIHDLDLARFILGEEMAMVFATGGCLVHERVGALGDIDVAAITMTSRSGVLATIQNARCSPFGYDQRIEILGSSAALFVENVSGDSMVTATADGVAGRAPAETFAERYGEAYVRELDAFLDFIEGTATGVATHNDGLAAQRLAEAADRSFRSGQPIHLHQAQT